MKATSDSVREQSSRAHGAWRLVTLVALLGALVLGWFAADGSTSGIHATQDLGLLHHTRCSDFARDAVECRTRWLPDATDWDLVPLFSALRLATAALVLVLVMAVAMAALRRRPLRDAWHAIAGLALVVLAAATIGAAPGDARFEAFAPTWGAWVGLAAGLCLFFTGLRVRRLDRFLGGALVAAALVGWASLGAPWLARPARGDPSSSYTFALLSRTHHWQGIRSTREHYLGDRIRRLDAHRLGRDLPYYTGWAAAGAGLLAMAALLAAARARAERGSLEPTPRRLLMASLVVFAVLGAAFTWTMLLDARRERPTPSWGLAVAVGGLVVGVWVARQGARGRGTPGAGAPSAGGAPSFASDEATFESDSSRGAGWETADAECGLWQRRCTSADPA